MWSIFTNAFRYALPILAGYFTNDVVDVVSNVTNKKDPTTGKAPTWLVIVVVGLLGLVVYLIISLVSPFTKRK